jgi:AraC-like DNA-binding protein
VSLPSESIGRVTLTPRDRLTSVLAPESVDALEELVSERAAAVIARLERFNGPRWLTLEQAAERLGCSRDAVRSRTRNRLETCRHGRHLHVSAAFVAAVGTSAHDGVGEPL